VITAKTNTFYAAFGSKNNAVIANNRNTTPPIRVTEKEIEKTYLTLNKDTKNTLRCLRTGRFGPKREELTGCQRKLYNETRNFKAAWVAS
jgi:hypothetical protein